MGGYDHRTRRDNLHNVLMTEDAEWLGRYDVPEVRPLLDFDPTGLEMVSVFHMANEPHPERCILNFCADDYIFERLWTTPRKYLPTLRRFAAVTMPDFSMFFNWPRALNIYNNWRNYTLARFWQDEGLTVIPSPGFTTEEDFDWEFEAFPHGGIVFLSSLGVARDEDCRKRFNAGYRRFVEECKPDTILLYGKDCRDEENRALPVPVVLFQNEQRTRPRKKKTDELKLMLDFTLSQ